MQERKVRDFLEMGQDECIVLAIILSGALRSTNDRNLEFPHTEVKRGEIRDIFYDLLDIRDDLLTGQNMYAAVVVASDYHDELQELRQLMTRG